MVIGTRCYMAGDSTAEFVCLFVFFFFVSFHLLAISLLSGVRAASGEAAGATNVCDGAPGGDLPSGQAAQEVGNMP